MGNYMFVCPSFCIFVIGFEDFGKFLKKKKKYISNHKITCCEGILWDFT